MRVKHFKKMVFDCHIVLMDRHDRELATISEYHGDTKKYDDCVVDYIQAIDYRRLKVVIYRDRLPRELVNGGKKDETRKIRVHTRKRS